VAQQALLKLLSNTHNIPRKICKTWFVPSFVTLPVTPIGR
jgi:hypothetical protein